MTLLSRAWKQRESNDQLRKETLGRSGWTGEEDDHLLLKWNYAGSKVMEQPEILYVWVRVEVRGGGRN